MPNGTMSIQVGRERRVAKCRCVMRCRQVDSPRSAPFVAAPTAARNGQTERLKASRRRREIRTNGKISEIVKMVQCMLGSTGAGFPSVFLDLLIILRLDYIYCNLTMFTGFTGQSYECWITKWNNMQKRLNVTRFTS